MSPAGQGDQEGGGLLGGARHPGQGEAVVRGGGGGPRLVPLPLPGTGGLRALVIIQHLVLKKFDEEISLLLPAGGVGLCLASISS